MLAGQIAQLDSVISQMDQQLNLYRAARATLLNQYNAAGCSPVIV